MFALSCPSSQIPGRRHRRIPPGWRPPPPTNQPGGRDRTASLKVTTDTGRLSISSVLNPNSYVSGHFTMRSWWLCGVNGQFQTPQFPDGDIDGPRTTAWYFPILDWVLWRPRRSEIWSASYFGKGWMVWWEGERCFLAALSQSTVNILEGRSICVEAYF